MFSLNSYVSVGGRYYVTSDVLGLDVNGCDTPRRLRTVLRRVEGHASESEQELPPTPNTITYEMKMADGIAAENMVTMLEDSPRNFVEAMGAELLFRTGIEVNGVIVKDTIVWESWMDFTTITSTTVSTTSTTTSTFTIGPVTNTTTTILVNPYENVDLVKLLRGQGVFANSTTTTTREPRNVLQSGAANLVPHWPAILAIAVAVALVGVA